MLARERINEDPSQGTYRSRASFLHKMFGGLSKSRRATRDPELGEDP
jgi:hypothetical protein